MLALLSGIVSILAATSVQAQTVWKGYTFFSTTNHPDYQHLEKLANEFARLSDNKIQTRVNVGGSLPIPGTAVTQAVGDGTLTFAHDGFFTGNVPLGGLTNLPLLTCRRTRISARRSRSSSPIWRGSWKRKA